MAGVGLFTINGELVTVRYQVLAMEQHWAKMRSKRSWGSARWCILVEVLVGLVVFDGFLFMEIWVLSTGRPEFLSFLFRQILSIVLVFGVRRRVLSLVGKRAEIQPNLMVVK